MMKKTSSVLYGYNHSEKDVLLLVRIDLAFV